MSIEGNILLRKRHKSLLYILWSILRWKSLLFIFQESHEPFTWASSSEESLKVESPVDMEDESRGSPFILTPVSPRVTPRTPVRQSVEDQKLQLKSLSKYLSYFLEIKWNESSLKTGEMGETWKFKSEIFCMVFQFWIFGDWSWKLAAWSRKVKTFHLVYLKSCCYIYP